MEYWKKVNGYENYEVSNLGNVAVCERRCKNGVIIPWKLLKLQAGKGGYHYVYFFKNGKYKGFRVCRLVALAFIPNPKGLPQVNHKNENKTDDRVENLEWCSPKDNSNYGTRNKRIAEANKGKRPGELCYFKNHKFAFRGSDHYKSRAVLQLTKEGTLVAEHGSTMEAHRNTGFSQTSIYKCCIGVSKQSHGFLWAFKDDRKL